MFIYDDNEQVWGTFPEKKSKVSNISPFVRNYIVAKIGHTGFVACTPIFIQRNCKKVMGDFCNIQA